MRALYRRLAQRQRSRILDVPDREGGAEMAPGLIGMIDLCDRSIPDRLHRSGVSDRKKDRQIDGLTRFPCPPDDFGPDTGRVAKRDDNRLQTRILFAVLQSLRAAAPVRGQRRSAIFDHRVAAQIAQIALGTAIDAFLPHVVGDRFGRGQGRFGWHVAPAQNQHADPGIG
jgi:hypothetical protein